MEILSLPELPDVTFVSHKRTIDDNALPLFTENMKDRGLFPSTVYGDDNCLPRCASLFSYGTEDNHLEMTARIVCELVRHEDKYRDNQYLTKWADTDGKTKIDNMFPMFSKQFNNEKMTDVSIQRIFVKKF